MVNQVILIGRTTRDIELKKASNGRLFGVVTIAVSRPFRNQATKEYDTDFIDVSLWGSTAENVAKYAGKGSLLSIRGRVGNRYLEYPNVATIQTIGLIGEQVSFIRTKAPGAVVINEKVDDGNENENKDGIDNLPMIDGITVEAMPTNEEFEAEFVKIENTESAEQQAAS